MISFRQFLENEECQGMIGPVYHGTQKDFEGFDPNVSNFYGTIYFTDNKNLAHAFATGEGFAGDPTKGHIYKACLDVKKPFDPNNQDHVKLLIPTIKKSIREKYKDTVTGADFNIPNTLTNPKTKLPVQSIEDALENILWRIENKSWRFIESKPILDFIKKIGFDAIITMERGAKNIAIFDPNKIHILDKQQAIPLNKI